MELRAAAQAEAALLVSLPVASPLRVRIPESTPATTPSVRGGLLRSLLLDQALVPSPEAAHQNADLLGKRGALLRTFDFWGRAIVVDDAGRPARKRAGEAARLKGVKARPCCSSALAALAQPLAKLAPPRPADTRDATAAAANRSGSPCWRSDAARRTRERQREKELRDETLRPHRSRPPSHKDGGEQDARDQGLEINSELLRR